MSRVNLFTDLECLFFSISLQHFTFSFQHYLSFSLFLVSIFILFSFKQTLHHMFPYERADCGQTLNIILWPLLAILFRRRTQHILLMRYWGICFSNFLWSINERITRVPYSHSVSFFFILFILTPRDNQLLTLACRPLLSANDHHFKTEDELLQKNCYNHLA